MYLHSLATAVPERSWSQSECWEILKTSGALRGLPERSAGLLDKVLNGANGIDRRHFATGDPGSLFTTDATGLYQMFEREAPRLAGKALEPALDRAGISASEIDALFVCTCTGYLCPGISSYLAEQSGMRDDVYLCDLVGLGCGAAIPMLRAAHGHAAANPKARIACVAVEVCSAAFYIDRDPGVLISLCLFGDGAAASVWSGEAGEYPLCAGGFDTHHMPGKRELLRFENRDGKLRNKLHKSVPEHAAGAVGILHDRYRKTLDPDSVPPVPIAHAGGRDVVEAVEAVLGGGVRLDSTREILRRYGNMSSPSVLFALEDHLARGGGGDHLWLTSFGAGFACHAFALSANGMG